MRRTIRAALAGTVASAAMAASAGAHTNCGDAYAIESGDTLYSVAQQCRVTLSRIMELNPAVDPRSLSVGAEIQLVSDTHLSAGGGDAADDRSGYAGGREGERYRVAEGDTLFSIAQALGVSLFELVNANEDVNPFALAVGELLDIPDGNTPGASVWIDPNRGTTATEVSLSARNLRPGDWVTIGVGPQASEWRRVREAQVNADGTLTAEVEVPDWADPGQDLIFVVDTDRGMTFKSGVFDVVERDGRDERGDGRDGERLSLEGRVQQGTECPTLRTPDGDTWSLVSDDVAFSAGEYVEVTGRRADVSQCMEGVGTIDVASIDEVRPPQDGSQAMTLEGRVARGAECYTLETPDGDVWSLTSPEVEFTRGEYVEVTGEKADASFCMQGVGTLTVSSIEEVEPPR